jgi:AraC family transcriptional regulator
MYQQQSISSNPGRVMARGIVPALKVDHGAEITVTARGGVCEETPAVAEDTTAVSLGQLRSLVAELYRALDETLREERSTAERRLQRAAAMLEAVESAPEPSAPSPARQGGLAPWQLRRVVAYIEENLDKPLRNTELATVARLSPFHFNVAFRKSVGDSPHEYIIRRRMERAQGLMLSTDASLSDIAATCGLADQAHFTRLFRRVVGESPGAWRRARANPRP